MKIRDFEVGPVCMYSLGADRAGPKHGRPGATAEGPSPKGAQAHICIEYMYTNLYIHT
jgi:hypothetical protein